MNTKRVFCFLLAGALGGTTTFPPAEAQWTRRVSGTSVRLTDVVMLDSLTAVAVGYARTIIRSTDGGVSWSKKLSLGANLNAVAFSSTGTGIAVGDNKTLLRSPDGGETWIPEAVGGLGNFLCIAHPDEERIYIGNDRGILRFTTNSGATWRDTSLGSLPLTDITLLRGSAEVSYSGQVISPYTAYRSTDNGGTWSFQEFPLSLAGTALRGDINAGGAYFAVGYDAGEPPFARIMRRRAADPVWSSFAFPSPGPSVVLRDISAPTPSTAYVCGSSGLILRTLDGGDSWTTERSGTTRRLNALDFYSAQIGVAVGDSGTILTTVNGTTGAGAIPENLPAAPVLHPVWPNPFNPDTEVRFDLPYGMPVSLAVYDLRGRRVRLLAEGWHAAGSHTARFTAAGIASGVYLARLEAGGRGAVRKLILLR